MGLLVIQIAATLFVLSAAVAIICKLIDDSQKGHLPESVKVIGGFSVCLAFISVVVILVTLIWI